MTIHEATFSLLKKLRSVYTEGEADQITDWVMENLTGSRKAERMLYKNSSLTPEEESRLNQYTERLLHHEPVQYVLGEAWFAGMKFRVNKSVLIPRPETEELVAWVIDDCKLSVACLTILDIGTGSGCIPVAIKKKLPHVSISAIDVCSEALFTATENAMALETAIDFRLLDFLDEEKWKELGMYDIIVSNPPYVRQQEKQNMHERVSGHEPHLALFVPDDDALLFYRKLADFSSVHLNRSGKLFVEINESFGTEVVNLFQSKGFSNIELRKDMQGKDRMVRAGK